MLEFDDEASRCSLFGSEYETQPKFSMLTYQ